MAARVPATSDSWPPPGALPPSSDAPRLRARCVAWPHRAPSAAPGVSGRADLAPEPGAGDGRGDIWLKNPMGNDEK